MIKRRPRLHETTWGPLNGQQGRQQIVLDLLRTVPFSAIVETGTYLGNTAEFLAKNSSLPIYTVEVMSPPYHYSRRRLKDFPSIRISRGDSRQFLRQLAADTQIPKTNVFFYLDAHWYEDLPLREEVEIIAKAWKGVVMMVDDFEVPGDSAYGFDDYGPGKRLCLSYLPPLQTLGLQAFFPSMPGSAETGAKRGSVVLADQVLAPKVTALTSLRVAHRRRARVSRLSPPSRPDPVWRRPRSARQRGKPV